MTKSLCEDVGEGFFAVLESAMAGAHAVEHGGVELGEAAGPAREGMVGGGGNYGAWGCGAFFLTIFVGLAWGGGVLLIER
jgi:hypothetical protein